MARRSAMRRVGVVSLCAVGVWACGSDPTRETHDADGPPHAAGSPSRAQQEEGAPIWFEEVARESGVDFVHVRGSEIRYHFPEVVGSGIALFDHDGDGDLDLYCVQAGDLTGAAEQHAGQYANRLFSNRGDGTFVDVTAASGAGDAGYGMGCAVGDYDGDGDLDLYVTNVGANVLLRNEGQGKFKDVTTEARVGDPRWGTSCGFLDYDGDGDLDLFVVNYLGWTVERERECFAGYGEIDYCGPNNYSTPSSDVLYRNEGKGTFTDVSRQAGIESAFGNGLGLAFGDFDGDGRIDMYVANDLLPNQLWMNQGGGRFENLALLAGCAVNMQGASEAGMGVAVVDLEEDGDLDLFMTHLRGQTNTFYVNQGGVFSDRTIQTGLSGPSLKYTGFGTGFADFDRDGISDLFVANGRVNKWLPALSETDPYAEPDQLFRGLGDGRFEEVPRAGLGHDSIHTSRGAAFGDLDNDGDIDIVVADSHEPLRILRNVTPGGAHWISFRVREKNGLDAVGALVGIRSGGRRQWRAVQTAYSYLSANDPRVYFGLGGEASIEGITVVWPDGTRVELGPLEADRLHEIRRAP